MYRPHETPLSPPGIWGSLLFRNLVFSWRQHHMVPPTWLGGRNPRNLCASLTWDSMKIKPAIDSSVSSWLSVELYTCRHEKVTAACRPHHEIMLLPVISVLYGAQAPSLGYNHSFLCNAQWGRRRWWVSRRHRYRLPGFRSCWPWPAAVRESKVWRAVADFHAKTFAALKICPWRLYILATHWIFWGCRHWTMASF